MYRKRTKLVKLSLLMILMILFAVIFSGVMVLAEEQSEESLEEEKREYEETIEWKSNTKNGEIDLSEGMDFGNSDWDSETFEGEEKANEGAGQAPVGNSSATTAVLAAIAGVLGATALTGRELLEKNKTSIIPKGNGVWVPEDDREQVEEMINKVASKEYYIDEDGFLNAVDDDEWDSDKSKTYSMVLDKLIAGDRKVVVSIGDGWSFYNPDKDKIEKIDFESEGGGISIGDNGTDQVVVVSGKEAELEDVQGNKIHSGSELLLAHELIHSLRGVYGLRNKDEDGGINEDEEGHTIQLENKIRYELGYGLRGDGDSSDDVNNDGIADGDDTYGKYNDDEDAKGWLDDIEKEKGLIGLIGSIYNYYSKSYYYRKYRKYKEYYKKYKRKYKYYYKKYKKYKWKYRKARSRSSRAKYRRYYRKYLGKYSSSYKKYKRYYEKCKMYYKKYKEKCKESEEDNSNTSGGSGGSLPSLGTPSLSISGGKKDSNGNYIKGSRITIKSKSKNAHHIAVNINGKWYEQNGDNFEKAITLNETGSIKIYAASRNAANGTSGSTRKESSKKTIKVVEKAEEKPKNKLPELGIPSLTITGGEKDSYGNYIKGSKIKIKSSSTNAHHIAVNINGKWYEQQGDKFEKEITLDETGSIRIYAASRNAANGTEGSTRKESSKKTIKVVEKNIGNIDEALPKYGDENSKKVKELQEMLIKVKAWTSTGVGATGNFGTITKESIEQFQRWCKEKWKNVVGTPLGNRYGYLESIQVTGELNKDTWYALHQAVENKVDVTKLLPQDEIVPELTGGDGEYPGLENTYTTVPKAYASYIDSLKAGHPNWEFHFFDAKGPSGNIVFDDFVKKQFYKNTTNDPNYWWRDSNGNPSAVLDGGDYRRASIEANKYFGDPRNYLNESLIWAFKLDGFDPELQSLDGVKSIFADGKKPNLLKQYSKKFYDIAREENVDAYKLAAKANTETGMGYQALAKGYRLEADRTYTVRRNGKNITYKLDKDITVYNFGSIGCTDDPKNNILFGALYALDPNGDGKCNDAWDSVDKGIRGAASFVKNKYLAKGQDTLYTMKFNVANGNYGHQYMTNIKAAATSECTSIRKRLSGIKDKKLVFKVPVFSNFK